MPRITHQQTNFTAGELSPRLRGRTDLARYQNAAQTLLNAYPVVQGGAKRRPGMRHVAPAKNADKKARAIPFIVSRLSAYALEFGDQYVRVFKNDGAPVVATAVAITGATNANPVVLTANAHGFSNGDQVYVRGVLGMTEINERWFTVAGAAANTFELSGEDGTLYGAYSSAGSVGKQYEIASPYTEAQLPDIDYVQDGSTMFLAHPSWPIRRLRCFADNVWDLSAAPFTTTPFAEIGRRPAVTLTLSAASVGAARTATASAGAFEPTDVGRAILYQSGIFVIGSYTSATVVSGDITVAFASTAVPVGWKMDASPITTCTPSASTPVGASITLTLGAAGWRAAEDVGKFVRINGGLAQITAVTSTTIVNATIVKELTSTTAAPGLAWTLEGSMWNADDGYPRTLTLHQQRLIASGSTGFPQTLWGSRIGEYLDFTQLPDDAAGFTFNLVSDEANQIAYVTSARELMALTYGGEFSLRGGVEKPITPTNVQIRQESNHGCANVRPATVARESVFVQRAGRKLRALGYRYDFDGFASPDISALSEHLLRAGLVELAWQQEPDSLLWAVRADGMLLSCTLDRDQEVIGWASHQTDGNVESICVIPTADAEQVWLVVKRTVQGVAKRYVERMDMVTSASGASERYLMLSDACVTRTGAAATTWRGLAHLEAKEAVLLGDGTLQPRQTVTAGVASTQRAVTNVQIGLPYTTRVQPLTPEFQSGEGSAQGGAMSTSRVILRLLESIGGTVNGQTIPVREFGVAALDQPPPLRSDDVELATLGWDRGKSDILIEQTEPLPFHVLAIIRTLTVNAG